MSKNVYGSTKGKAEFTKLLVYGESGVGKTGLIATAPNPVIISSESKLRVLGGLNIPVITIKDFEGFEEAYKDVTTGKFFKYGTVCIDSISDIAELVLNELLKEYTDGRQAYGELNMKIMDMLKKFKMISDKNVYVIGKQERVGDPSSSLAKYSLLMPGRTLSTVIPYEFDYVFVLRATQGKDKEGKTKSRRFLQTQPCNQYQASGDKALDLWEKPNLKNIFEKLNHPIVKKTEKGVKNGKTAESTR